MSLFQGCTIVLDYDGLEARHGASVVRKLHGLIKEHGGLVHDIRQDSDTAPKEATHAVVEWDNGIFAKQKIPLVNVIWVYACIYAGDLLPVQAPLYGPLSDAVPESNIPSTENGGVRVSCSGFKGLDRKIVESMCSSLYLTFQREFHVGGLSATNILVVSDTNEASAKAQAAKTAGIPIVGFRWLLDSFMEWKYISTDTPKYSQGSASDMGAIVVRVQPQEDAAAVICPDSVDESDERNSSSHEKSTSRSSSSSSSFDDDGSLSSTPTPSAEPDMGRIMDDASPPPPPHVSSAEKVHEQTPLEQNSIPVVKETISIGGNTKRKAEDNTPEQTGPSKREQRGRPTHMTLSGMHSDEQERCIDILKKMSIPFTVSHSWDPKFTHIITPAFKRNEKCLCALASGSWIISPKYLDQCLAKNTTKIPESLFEISDGDAKISLEMNVPKFWRVFQQECGKRMFQGLVCALHNIKPSHNPPRGTITAIISAGGGTVIPFSSSLGTKNATRKCHLIITHHSSTQKKKTEQPQSPISSIPCITSKTLITWMISPSRMRDDTHQMFTKVLDTVNQ